MATIPSSSPSAPIGPVSPDAFPLHRLPVEIVIEVFKQADYFSLKQLRLVCKTFNAILAQPAFRPLPFRLVKKPKIQSEKDRKALLPKLPKRKMRGDDGEEYEEEADCSPFLRMHPVLSEARWTLRTRNWRDVELRSPANKMRLPRLGGTKLCSEYATDPPIDDFEVLIVGPSARQNILGI
ncbi:hypothetical protein V8E36_003853 [Tilletia maclaganii]